MEPRRSSVADLGGGHAARMGELWIKYLGITWDDLPNWKAHRAADKEHVDMFLSIWEEFGRGENEAVILQAARESEELYRVLSNRCCRCDGGGFLSISRYLHLNTLLA
jgi:hypothetical protein